MKKIIFVVLALSLAVTAQAEIYKHVDADGRVTYTNIPMKGAVKLDIAPPVATTPPPGQPAAVKPPSFPKVDKAVQEQRDRMRREILELELAAERKALENAKLAYAEAEKVPEMITVTVDGKQVRRRNIAKYQEKLRVLQEQIDQHKRNIELLEEEIARL